MVNLDPHLAAAAAGLPPTDLTDVVAARSTNVDRRPVGGYARADEVWVENVTIEGPAGPLRLRTYRSSSGASPRARVLWIHGGAFMMGTLDSSDAVCQQLALEAGVAVVNVEYRLAPENPYPAGLDDAEAALRWVDHHVHPLGMEAPLVVAGSSAGGCLAAALALRARDRQGPVLAAQLLVQPVLDSRRVTGTSRSVGESPVFTSLSNAVMWEAYLGGRPADAYAAPALAEDLAGLPPAYVTAASHDPLRDEAIDYARRLLDAGVLTELHVYPGTFHGFDSLVPDAAVSRRASADLVEALDRVVRRHAMEPTG